MVKGNIWKNIIIITLLIILYFPIHNYLINSNLINNIGSAGDVLVAISVIAVMACFGNFAFTYEKVNRKKKSHRYLSHCTTGLLMLVIGISLIFTSILIEFIMGKFIVINLTLIILYVACIGYDFWDLLRNEN